MIPPEVIQKLTLIAVVFEVLHRLVIIIINAVRLVFDENYRKETLGTGFSDSAPAPEFEEELEPI